MKKVKAYSIHLFLAAVLFLQNAQQLFAQDCGVERWAVKTLSDSDTLQIDFSKIVNSSIQEQISLQKPLYREKRLPSESVVFSIECNLVGYKREAHDKDIHLILQDPVSRETMVAEIPSHRCSAVLQTSRARLFQDLQTWFVQEIGYPTGKFVYLKTPVRLRITGIGFFDHLHGQNGMAANGREIHPVLSMEKLH